MISGAAQHHKRRQPSLRKTDAMQHAERPNGQILDEIWRSASRDAFQVCSIPSQISHIIFQKISTNLF